MPNTYRNINSEKPDLKQTMSSTSENPKLNKAKQVRRDDDKTKNISVGIYDIDLAFRDFLVNNVKPFIEDDGQIISVPVIYANPEKWSSAQKDSFIRDTNGKIQTPIIVFKRTGLSTNQNAAKLKVLNSEDAHQSFERKYTKANRYDQFSLLTGQKPVKEYIAVERPDYLDVSYEMTVWCDYMEQLNKVVEQIIFFQGRSFGDRFKFQVKGDSYNFETIQDINDDRIVRASITLVTKAYIIPEYAGMIPNNKKIYSVGKIIFNESPKLSGGLNEETDFK
jgi:hypothetical protein